MKSAMLALFLCLCCAVCAAQRLEVAAGYLNQGSHTVDGSGFDTNGGRADAAVSLVRGFSAVGEFAGSRGANIGGTSYGSTVMTYLGGLRFSRVSGGYGPAERPRRGQIFAQLLLGGAHASDGVFVSNGKTASSANGFAIAAGGGIDLGLCHRLALRVLQADYLQTRLPNLSGGFQNHFRIGAGLVLQLR
jgi:hypothetical protein